MHKSLIWTRLTMAVTGGVTAASLTVPAHATLVGDFQLNGSLTNAVSGSSLTLTNNAGTGSLGSTGITFGAGLGPDISGMSSLTDYSVEIRFSFSTVTGWRKVLDFRGSTSDDGLYVNNGQLQYWYGGALTAGGAFAANTLKTIVFTRDATGKFSYYIDGILVTTATDKPGTTISSLLRLFRDDTVTGGRENSAGFVDYIKVYDTALSAAVAAPLTTTPEPGTWATMVIGFGMIGHSLRRNKGKQQLRFATR